MMVDVFLEKRSMAFTANGILLIGTVDQNLDTRAVNGLQREQLEVVKVSGWLIQASRLRAAQI